MAKSEKWVSVNGRLTEKVTTRTSSNGDREITRQKAYRDCFGGRNATSVTSRTKITK